MGSWYAESLEASDGSQNQMDKVLGMARAAHFVVLFLRLRVGVHHNRPLIHSH